MKSHYQATPQQWGIVASEAADGSAMDACILELRRRMEALDGSEHNPMLAAVRAQSKAVAHLGNRVERLEELHAVVDGSAMNACILELRSRIEALEATQHEYKAEAQPAADAQKLTLVDSMADLIDPDDPICARGTARAAIRVVAEWLRSEYPQREGYGTAFWADLLHSEASR